MTTGFAVLREAIHNRTQVMVCHGPDMNVGRYLIQLDSAVGGEESFWCRLLEGDAAELDKLIQSKAEVEVSFATINSHVFFNSVVLQRKWWGSRVRLQWPFRMQIVERRESSREPIPDDVVVTAMLADAAGRVRVQARLGDISLTGASFLCETSEPLSALQNGQAIRIEVAYGGHQHRVDALCRYARPISPSLVRIGAQFDAERALAAGPLARFRMMLEELERMRIRRTFRTQLTKGTFEAA
ncbi:MAG TPA: PilZ domain-containing protein [Tepidisphaeraceae bacterium]|jgi:hypothetical protein|nr:PilZ domain-containing protein [Tepidisphaeraceae bacterium]